MASIIRMPGISADAEEAVLVDWFVEEGGEVSSGSALAAVETEKATVDIEADDSGTVWKILSPAGASVEIGAPIAILLAAGEGPEDGQKVLDSLGIGAGSADAAPAAPEAAPAAPEAQAPAPAPAAVVEAAPAPSPAAEAPAQEAPQAVSLESGDRVFASPLARKLARENGIEPSTLVGSGPGGRILRDDVLSAVSQQAAAPAQASAPAAAPAHAPAPVAGEVVPHSRLRQAVANALQASKQNSPHFYLTTSVRVDSLMELRSKINEASPVRVSVNDLVIAAVARAFVDVPAMNVQWREEGMLTLGSIDVSVAIASEKGLVTPVVRFADTLRVGEISTQVKAYVEAANAGKLRQSDLEGGSFTVTNLGMFGIEEFQAIINPPQVGILAVGAVSKQAVVGEDGRLAVGQVMKISLSADHRPVDGALAAQWLQAVKARLESPLSLLV